MAGAARLAGVRVSAVLTMPATARAAGMWSVERESSALEGASIVSFAVDRWTDVPRCRHHVMSTLARRNRVLFTSSPWYLRDVLRGGSDDGALTRIHDTLHTYTPPRWLPYTYRFPRADRLSRQLRSRAMTRILDRLGMERPVLYIWHPSFAAAIGEVVDARAVVYHCYDEYAAFTGVDRAQVADDEARVLARADLVLTVSEGLYARKRVFNANTHLVRNGVDYDLFATAQDPALAVAADVRDLPRPVIGCVTRIVPDYFDAELLEEVFRRRPEWSFVVVGPRCAHSSALSRLESLPNVRLLGRRDLSVLPSYLKAFDACLIPYVLTENKQLADPLKAYEYLAAGKPVISKPLTALEAFGDVISFATTADEWIEAIHEALHDHSPERVARRQMLASQNTWDERVERISRLIADVAD
jgi:glycosyltransferase involved in cell wall biosynthesis